MKTDIILKCKNCGKKIARFKDKVEKEEQYSEKKHLSIKVIEEMNKCASCGDIYCNACFGGDPVCLTCKDVLSHSSYIAIKSWITSIGNSVSLYSGASIFLPHFLTLGIGIPLIFFVADNFSPFFAIIGIFILIIFDVFFTITAMKFNDKVEKMTIILWKKVSHYIISQTEENPPHIFEEFSTKNFSYLKWIKLSNLKDLIEVSNIVEYLREFTPCKKN